MGLFKTKSDENWKINYIKEFNEMRAEYEKKILAKQNEIDELKKQIDELFIWRIGFISKRALIKERAAGIKKTRVLNIIKCTIKYPILWIKLYPFFLIPPFMCKYIVKINNKRKGYKSESTTVNRQGDVIG